MTRLFVLLGASFVTWFMVLSTVQNSLNVHNMRSCKPPSYTIKRIDAGPFGIFTVCESTVKLYGPTQQLKED